MPTFHGVVARRAYSSEHPEVLDTFLQAQLDATDFLHDKPLEAAQLVADNSGLPAEVVYLYNGPGGTSFDTPLKPQLIQAFKGDVPYLKSIGDFADFDIDKFVDDRPLRIFGRGLHVQFGPPRTRPGCGGASTGNPCGPGYVGLLRPRRQPPRDIRVPIMPRGLHWSEREHDGQERCRHPIRPIVHGGSSGA